MRIAFASPCGYCEGCSLPEHPLTLVGNGYSSLDRSESEDQRTLWEMTLIEEAARHCRWHQTIGAGYERTVWDEEMAHGVPSETPSGVEKVGLGKLRNESVVNGLMYRRRSDRYQNGEACS